METEQTQSTNWHLYNRSQVNEKTMFLKVMSDAIDAMEIPYSYRGGRPHIATDDMLKCVVIKVFNNFSTRRTMAELQLAYALGYIRTIPHYNSIINYMESEEITPYLEKLYLMLALPLYGVEQTFAADATGFSTLSKKNWFDSKYCNGDKKPFVKLHIMSGVKTNIITKAKITSSYRSDNPEFPELLLGTSNNFKIREVYADAGYTSSDNCKLVEEIGATPYILPRENTDMTFRRGRSEAWKRMVIMWHENKEFFMKKYHMRSNVESTFSMMKRKFLPYIRSKNPKAQRNEILCKVACHNGSVLVKSLFMLDVKIDFMQ